MIRFILKSTYYDERNQTKGEEFFTIDGDIIALENALLSGGHSEHSHYQNHLIGAEVIPVPAIGQGDKMDKPHIKSNFPNNIPEKGIFCWVSGADYDKKRRNRSYYQF